MSWRDTGGILAGYIFNPDLADKSNPAAHADDGRGAYLQLEKNANGGSSTTANVYMRHLFDIDKALPIKEKVLAHTDAYRRLLLCEEPSRTLDALMKGHLLYLLGNDPHYIHTTPVMLLLSTRVPSQGFHTTMPSI